jgi:hypothetical protein
LLWLSQTQQNNGIATENSSGGMCNIKQYLSCESDSNNSWSNAGSASHSWSNSAATIFIAALLRNQLSIIIGSKGNFK